MAIEKNLYCSCCCWLCGAFLFLFLYHKCKPIVPFIGNSRADQKKINNKKLYIIHVMILWISREQLKATLTRFNKFAKMHKSINFIYWSKRKINFSIIYVGWFCLPEYSDHIYLYDMYSRQTHEDRAEHAGKKWNITNITITIYKYIFFSFIFFLYFMYMCAFKRESSSYIYKTVIIIIGTLAFLFIFI